MKNKRSLKLLLLMLWGLNAHGQNTRFTISGAIEFVKTVNMLAIIKKTTAKGSESNAKLMMQNYQQSHPQFKKLNSKLIFSRHKTLFGPDKADPGDDDRSQFNYPLSNPDNIVLTDLTRSFSISRRKVFETEYTVSDSLTPLVWKLTNEKREIAGYACRRANGLIMDSVYVVAFYAEKIPVAGGPASFHGLPGMILGLVLPRENVNWFAVKVTDMVIEPNTLSLNKGNASINTKIFKEKLTQLTANWGSVAQQYIKMFLF